MGAVTVDERHIAGAGTPEPEWSAWLAGRALPQVEAASLIGATQRAVVVAPHPDDEVLMVGGLLAQLGDLARRTLLVAVTDGEASHPGSRRWTPGALARQRTAETRTALQALGVRAEVLRPGLPDGGVTGHGERLARWLQAHLRADDVVFTTWSLDGHPDHEACAHAARAATSACGARLVEVPVWGWHWARAGAPTMPWQRAHQLLLPPPIVARKLAAVRAFASQLERDPDCADTPVLRPSTLLRAQRTFEVFFT